MNKRINDFIKRIQNIDVSDYQKKIIEEYMEIGDSDVYGGKLSGSGSEKEGAEYIAGRLQELGLDNVELVPVRSDLCCFSDATLSSAENTELVVKPYGATTVGTGSGGILAEIADLGKGLVKDFEKEDVAGKIVMINGSIDIEEACPYTELAVIEAEKRGAAAVLIYFSDETILEDTVTAFPVHLLAGIPVLSVSRKDARKIKECGGKFQLDVSSQCVPDGSQTYEVVAEIKGSESSERIIFSAHLDHFCRCIQDNISAVATLLGIAKMMKEAGYEPKRTITFVFNGAHEVGHINASSTDLKGAYELFANARPDLIENAIANINFEYTAMAQDELRAITSYEGMNTYLNFIKYMPDNMPGFGAVASDVRRDDYFLGTWTDSAMFMLNGVPYYMNDAIGDQIYKGTSPYMGRDHSTKDNWEIFSEDALRSNTQWYASFAAYLDSTPLLELNFANRMEAIQLTEDEISLTSECGIETEDLRSAVEDLRKHGRELYEEIYIANMSENGADVPDAAETNRELMEISRKISGCSDSVTSQLIGCIAPLYKSYLLNLYQMIAARSAVEGGSIIDAAKALDQVDIASASYYFNEEIADKLASLIEGENATWTKGRTGKCFTLGEVMTMLREAGEGQYDADKICGALDKEIDELKSLLSESILKTAAELREADSMLMSCLDRVRSRKYLESLNEEKFPTTEKYIEWIKGFTKFPHRMTGTPEGKASAEYVKETFESIGLSDVHIEAAQSLCSSVKNMELKVNGEKIDAYAANGTNRKSKYGTFEVTPENCSAEVVYLKKGKDADFEGKDVKGKIVLCDVDFFDIHLKDTLDWKEDTELYDPDNRINKSVRKYDIFSPNDWPYNYFNAVRNGAIAFIGILNNFMDCCYHHEDYSVIMMMEDRCAFPIPGVWISRQDGARIREMINAGEDVTASVSVKTTYEMAEANNVVGVLPGKSDDIILVHSHHDAVCEGAVQDASGMSEVFAVAEYFAQIPMEQREKTLMFAGLDSHYTDYEGHVTFMENRKKNGQNIKLDIALEHIGKEMDIDEDNNLILRDEPESRLLYVSKSLGILPQIREMLSRNGLDKTIIVPSEEYDENGYNPGGVCSDAAVSWENHIPLVSLISTPMYLYHNSDTFEKVHVDSLRPVGKAIAELVSYLMK